jgi:hypothetical protein
METGVLEGQRLNESLLREDLHFRVFEKDMGVPAFPD